MSPAANSQDTRHLPHTSSSERILTTALDLFAVKGYDATAVREICEAARITKPTLYHFFGSKDGVLKSLVTDAFEEFRQLVERSLAGTRPLRDKLKTLARSFFSDARTRPKLWRFMHAIVWAPPGTAPPTDCSKFYETVLKLLGGAIDQAVAQGEIAPGSTGVRLLVLMGTLSEAANGFVIVGRPELTPELADALIDTIVGGWSPSLK
jgi:TetR/AcrR family transcriptional regulator